MKESRLKPDEITHTHIIASPAVRPPSPPPDLHEGANVSPGRIMDRQSAFRLAELTQIRSAQSL